MSDNSCISSGQSCGSSSNFPQFIDSASCLCGLVNDPEPSRNGNTAQDWRCIGDATKNVGSGTTGKWFNTTLGSEELSGINEPLAWGENPPDTSQAYVVVTMNGQQALQKLGSDGSSSLEGNDGDCTGKNDTSASGKYYGYVSNSSSNSSSGMSSSMMSSMMSSSTMSSMMSSSMASSMASTMASATATMTTGTSMTAGSSPSATSAAGATTTTAAGSSDAPRPGYTSLMLLGMLLAPMVAMMS